MNKLHRSRYINVVVSMMMAFFDACCNGNDTGTCSTIYNGND